MIGINSQIATGGGSGSVGIGFAVPINTAKRLLPELREGGEIERAYLGIVMRRSPTSSPSDLNLPAERGRAGHVRGRRRARPTKAGLRGGRTGTATGIPAGGDLIVEVDGEKVSAPEDVSAAIADDKPGDDGRRSSTTAATTAGPRRVEARRAPGRLRRAAAAAALGHGQP